MMKTTIEAQSSGICTVCNTDFKKKDAIHKAENGICFCGNILCQGTPRSMSTCTISY